MRRPVLRFLLAVAAVCWAGAAGASNRLFYENFDDQVNNLTHVGSTNGSIGNVDPPHSVVAENYDGRAGYCSRIRFGYLGTGLYDQYVDVGESSTGEHYISYWYRLDATYAFARTGDSHKVIRFWHSNDSNMSDIMMEAHLYGNWDMQLCPTVNGSITWDTGRYLSTTPNHAAEFSAGVFNWHHVEVYMKYDSPPGAGNGILRAWIDGTLAFERYDARLTKDGYPSYTRFSMPSNKSGSSDPDYYFVDEIEVWDGMPEGAPVGDPPPTPENLRRDDTQ